MENSLQREGRFSRFLLRTFHLRPVSPGLMWPVQTNWVTWWTEVQPRSEVALQPSWTKKSWVLTPAPKLFSKKGWSLRKMKNTKWNTACHHDVLALGREMSLHFYILGNSTLGNSTFQEILVFSMLWQGSRRDASCINIGPWFVEMTICWIHSGILL